MEKVTVVAKQGFIRAVMSFRRLTSASPSQESDEAYLSSLPSSSRHHSDNFLSHSAVRLLSLFDLSQNGKDLRIILPLCVCSHHDFQPPSATQDHACLPQARDCVFVMGGGRVQLDVDRATMADPSDRLQQPASLSGQGCYFWDVHQVHLLDLFDPLLFFDGSKSPITATVRQIALAVS